MGEINGKVSWPDFYDRMQKQEEKFAWVKPWREYMTPEVVELVQAWASEDFEQFGYPIELS